ncbi:hypothetical protein AVEN_206035-1, partial [Araneus ventricosus]
MPFGPANSIDTPYGQYVYDCTHPRMDLWTHRTGVKNNLTEARTDVRSIMSPYGSTVCSSYQ